MYRQYCNGVTTSAVISFICYFIISIDLQEANGQVSAVIIQTLPSHFPRLQHNTSLTCPFIHISVRQDIIFSVIIIQLFFLRFKTSGLEENDIFIFIIE